jgi:hypothetical protein
MVNYTTGVQFDHYSCMSTQFISYSYLIMLCVADSTFSFLSDTRASPHPIHTAITECVTVVQPEQSASNHFCPVISYLLKVAFPFPCAGSVWALLFYREIIMLHGSPWVWQQQLMDPQNNCILVKLCFLQEQGKH